MIEFTVSGMSCGSCARTVGNAVRALASAAVVQVDLPGKKVCIESSAAPAAIAAAIERAGYKVERQPA